MAAVLQDDGLTGPYQRVHADELAALARTQAATLRERGGHRGHARPTSRGWRRRPTRRRRASTRSPPPIRTTPAVLRAQLAGAAATAAELAGA